MTTADTNQHSGLAGLPAEALVLPPSRSPLRRAKEGRSEGLLRRAASAQAGHGLPRKQRLVRSSQFKEAYAQNQRFVGRFMVLWLCQGRDASLRVGVVASKKVGKAVERNRAKRRLREAFRLNRHALEGTVDVVLVARRAILRAKWEDVQEDLLSLVNRAGLLKSDKLLSRP